RTSRRSRPASGTCRRTRRSSPSRPTTRSVPPADAPPATTGPGHDGRALSCVLEVGTASTGRPDAVGACPPATTTRNLPPPPPWIGPSGLPSVGGVAPAAGPKENTRHVASERAAEQGEQPLARRRRRRGGARRLDRRPRRRARRPPRGRSPSPAPRA